MLAGTGRNGAPRAVIDVHAHFIPDAYRTALTEAGCVALDGGMPIPAWSVDAALATMDGHGVTKAILSVSSPGLNFVEVTAEAALAREINQNACDIVAQGAGRFGAFATLPVGDVPAALTEIDYAFDVLRLDGVILETNHRGVYPGAAAMASILAALDRRGACVLLHPTSPACGCAIGRPAPLIEFPFETTRAVVDLIYSGTLTRYPNIRFILAHAGGVLPFLADRIANFTRIAPDAAPNLDPATVMAQLRRLYYDTALSATAAQIAALKTIAPTSHILFGSDWPFSPAMLLGGSIAALRTMDCLDDAERDAIFADNARGLLG